MQITFIRSDGEQNAVRRPMSAAFNNPNFMLMPISQAVFTIFDAGWGVSSFAPITVHVQLA